MINNYLLPNDLYIISDSIIVIAMNINTTPIAINQSSIIPRVTISGNTSNNIPITSTIRPCLNTLIYC